MILSILNSIVESFNNNLIAENRYRMILDGLQVTLLITFCSIILGTLLGGLVCWARMSRHRGLQRIAKVYINLMRGTPVLVLLMLMYYVFMAPLRATGVVVAIVTFAMNTSAYIGEMLRSGIESIDKGQTEAGLALGYTPRQVFVRIILPQVVRKILPVYLGEMISLLKGTSIVGYIAVMDMTRASDLIRSRTFDAFFPLIVTAAIYFLVAWLIGLLFNSLLERRRLRTIVAAAALGLLGLLGSIPSIMEYSNKNAQAEPAPPLFRQLEGRPVGTVIGSIQDMALTRYAPKADIMRFSNLTDLLASLQNGKTDVLVGENITVMTNPSLATWVDTIDVGLPPTPIAVCTQLGNTELQEDFNSYMADIRADGTYRKIHERWMVSKDISQNPIPQQRGRGKTITVGTFPGFPPYNFIKNGEPSGFEIDLLTEWANRRNYRLKFLFMEFSSQIPAVQTGKVDLSIGSIAVTEERQKNVLFTDGYYYGRIMFYTRKGELEKIFKIERDNCIAAIEDLKDGK